MPNCPGDNGDWDCSGGVTPLDVTWYVFFVYKSQGNGPCDPCVGTDFPDLTIGQSDIYFNHDPVEVGEPVWIGVRMRNVGWATAYAPTVHLYQGDPDLGGTWLGDAVTIDIPPGGNSGFYGGSFIFDSPGSVEIYGIADMLEVIEETNEGNNKAYHILEVTQGGQAPPQPAQVIIQGPVQLQRR